jgi:hypothetical protein
MFLKWWEDGLKEVTPEMPAPGYKWSETPRLNHAIRERHRSQSPAAVMNHFEAGYRRILGVVEDLPSAKLLVPGAFAWTGRYPLTTYLGPNTASHYRFAARVLKRWLRGAAGGGMSTAVPNEPVQPATGRGKTRQANPTRSPLSASSSMSRRSGRRTP